MGIFRCFIVLLVGFVSSRLRNLLVFSWLSGILNY